MTTEQINDALTGLEKGNNQFVLMSMWSDSVVTKQSVKMLHFSLVESDMVQVTYTDAGLSISQVFPLWNCSILDSRSVAVTNIRNLIDKFDFQVRVNSLVTMDAKLEALIVKDHFRDATKKESE
jgi:hypothetical protein